MGLQGIDFFLEHGINVDKYRWRKILRGRPLVEQDVARVACGSHRAGRQVAMILVRIIAIVDKDKQRIDFSNGVLNPLNERPVNIDLGIFIPSPKYFLHGHRIRGSDLLLSSRLPIAALASFRQNHEIHLMSLFGIFDEATPAPDFNIIRMRSDSEEPHR